MPHARVKTIICADASATNTAIALLRQSGMAEGEGYDRTRLPLKSTTATIELHLWQPLTSSQLTALQSIEGIDLQ